MYDTYYEPPEPTRAEQYLFDRFADKYPDWTDQQLWDAVDEELEASADFAREYRFEQMRDLGKY